MKNQGNGNGFNYQSIFESLEDRVLFDGVPDATFLVLPQDEVAPVPAQVQNVHQIDTEGPKEIVFIDAGVENSEQLLAGILESKPNSSLEVRILDANSDGVESLDRRRRFVVLRLRTCWKRRWTRVHRINERPYRC